MKYWYDTEFYEDGQRIHLISIGIVAEDGREYYAESDFVWNMVPTDHWLWENVFPYLDFNGQTARPAIARGVHSFMTNGYTDHDNQLWGYYSAYDHVVLAQLFGRMVDMPQGIPWFTQDVKQELDRIRLTAPNTDLPEQNSTAHNALNDAKWTKESWLYLQEREMQL